MITKNLVDRETRNSAVDKLLNGNNAVVYGVTNVMCVELLLRRIQEQVDIVVDV